jgi:polyisoprenoid-binding protein YceI
MTKSILIVLSFLFISAKAFSAVEKFDLQPSLSKVEFKAVGMPSALKIVGVSNQIDGGFVLQDGVLSGEAILKLETLETGIKLRDEHMKNKYLQIAQYPLAKLRLRQLIIKGTSAEIDLKETPFEGELELHGVTKPIQGILSLQGDKSKLSVISVFKIKSTDFQIDTPKFAGITLASDIDLKIEAIAKASQ